MRERYGLVLVANRLPVRRVARPRGASRGGPGWSLSPGGLVSALAPLLRASHGAWVGWGGTAAESLEPFDHDGLHLFPVPLSKAELDAFYYGFSNRTLWPLYHDAIRWPEYHREWWEPYLEINERYAEEASRCADKGATVWVHDYHLQLVPGILRRRRPDLKLGFFLHVPFPPQELFAQLPWRREILEGMLGADVVGFQTPEGARNFFLLARRYTKARGDSVRELTWGDRTVRIDSFPVSIDVARFEELARDEGVRKQAARFREKLGAGRKIILGVDRLDYTKGIDIRLKAFQELLERGTVSLADCVLVQTAVPSREHVVAYAGLKERVEGLVGRINGEFAELGRVAVHYLHRNLPPEELVSLYVAADVMLVTPFRDGMNLVAKEYVTTRLDDTGVLVLSEFTGAARELRQSLLVNPHDVDGLAGTLGRALRMPRGEMTRRMRKLRAVVRSYDVHMWGRDFLAALGAEAVEAGVTAG
jgi:trehalose 6-phosphate synthase